MDRADGGPGAVLDDVVAFIDGEVDDSLIERWARAATLLPPARLAEDRIPARLPPATFAVLRLVHSGALDDGTVLKRTPNMLVLACAGDAIGATSAALRRLGAVGRGLPVAALVESAARTRRVAAALAFPLSRDDRRRLESMVLPPSSTTQKEHR
jgi:CRISPR-associated protein Csx17